MSIKEVTGTLPLVVSPSDGTPLLDWHIKGAAGGVGKAGLNKLKMREYALADGLSNNSSDPTYRQNIRIDFFSIPVVPPNTPYTTAYQQWMRAETSYIGDDRKDYTADDRPCDYQHCQFFGRLKAGSYKLVCEYYRDSGYPWLLRNHDNENPYIALLTEDNVLLVKKSMNQAYAPVVQDPLFDGYDSYRHDFYHEEYPFTVSSDTSVGFISKIYPEYNSNVFTRFQIVPADTAAVPFYIDADVNGVTCWEPYKVILPLTITHGEQSMAISIDLGTEFLGENDTVDFTTTHIAIPTYSGANTITVDTDIQPSEMYAKFSTSGTVYIRRNGVWEQELTPHRYENQVWSDISEKERENGEWADKS